MRLVEIDVHVEQGDQVFSYHRHDTDGMYHFNASLLARIRKQIPSEFKLIRMTMLNTICA